MKTLFAACLLLTGCGPDYVEAPVVLTNGVRVAGTSLDTGSLRIIELQGHRFAVLDLNGRCALCEVTDASLIQPK